MLTQQKIWKRFANNFQLYRKSAAKCFLPNFMKAAKQTNKITPNNFLINVYHYWGFAKENGRFPTGVCHALQMIHSWKSSTNFWEKSCVLNTIIFWQSANTFNKVWMVKYAENVTQKKPSDSLLYAHIYFDVGQICRIETIRVKIGRKNQNSSKSEDNSEDVIN